MLNIIHEPLRNCRVKSQCNFIPVEQRGEVKEREKKLKIPNASENPEQPELIL